MKRVLYLHGFLSSPQSTKVGALQRAFAGVAQVAAPDLNLSPKGADAVIEEKISELLRETGDPSEILLVGSSLGGFYAGRAAARHSLRAVLLNPCLDPWMRVSEWKGKRQIYGTQRFLEVKESFAEDFIRLNEEVSPEAANVRSTLVVLSTGDEILPWQKAQEAFGCARQLILPGEDHRISNFEIILPRLVDFAVNK